MSEWYLNPVGGYALTSIVALALVLLLTFLGLPRHKLTPRRRGVLLGLRLAVIALALMAMLRPALVFTKTRKQSATLVLLADRSRSMMVADAVGGKTRWELLRSSVDEARPTLEQIAENLDVELYTFDANLHPLEFQAGAFELGKAPDGEQTAIGAALDDVLRRNAGKRLAGVILLSDGAQRAYAPRDAAPQGPTRRLADLGYPLYTFAFGQARGLGQARDIALKDLSVNQTVYVKNELDVRAARSGRRVCRPVDPRNCSSRRPAGRCRTWPPNRSRWPRTASRFRSSCTPFRKRPANTRSRCACPTSPASW